MIRSSEINEENICGNIPYEAATQKGETALLIYRSDSKKAPGCRNPSGTEGNVVYSILTPFGVKFGSVFDDESSAKVGNVDDLINYLDKSTSQETRTPVGDRYTGVKEEISLADPVAVPVWVAVSVSILLVIVILATIILCSRNPIGKVSRRQAEQRKRHGSSRSLGSTSERSSRKDNGSPSKDSKSRRHSRRHTSKDTSRASRSERPAPREKKTSTGGERSVPFKSMEKIDEKKKDNELKPRDLAEMIKQPLTSKEFEVYLNRLAHFAIEYYDNPSAYSVTPDVTPGFLYKNLPKCCPENPDSFDDIYNDIKFKIMPGLTHWQHPLPSLR